MRPPLTEAQQELYNYLVEYIGQHYSAPSIREMMYAMRLRSPAPIQSRLDHLEAKGYINRTAPGGHRGKARNVSLVRTTPEGIPLKGIFESGILTDTSPQSTALNLVRTLPPLSFAYQVIDESLTDYRISPGDVLILTPPTDSVRTIRAGTIVLVKLDAGLELRELEHGAKRLTLLPLDPDAEPLMLHYHQVSIRGVVIAVWRNLMSA